MKSIEKNNIILIRLFSDEDLSEKLMEACKIHKLKTGVILSGIGQLKKVKLGFFKKDKSYSIDEYEQPHELLILSGNISKKKEKYFLHLHVVIANNNKQIIGGHLVEGNVEVTNEIFILKTEINARRDIDVKYGLEQLLF